MRLALLVFAWVLAMPAWAAACAVCAPGDEESRSAFIWTTVFLSVLPPGMVGGLVWWLWRQHRQREQSGDPVGDPGASGPSSL